MVKNSEMGIFAFVRYLRIRGQKVSYFHVFRLFMGYNLLADADCCLKMSHVVNITTVECRSQQSATIWDAWQWDWCDLVGEVPMVRYSKRAPKRASEWGTFYYQNASKIAGKWSPHRNLSLYVVSKAGRCKKRSGLISSLIHPRPLTSEGLVFFDFLRNALTRWAVASLKR